MIHHCNHFFVNAIHLACPSFPSGYLVGRAPSLLKSNPFPALDTYLCLECSWGETCSLPYLPLTSWPLNHKQTFRATQKSYLSNLFTLTNLSSHFIPLLLSWDPEASLILPLKWCPFFIFHQNRINQKRTSTSPCTIIYPCLDLCLYTWQFPPFVGDKMPHSELRQCCNCDLNPIPFILLKVTDEIFSEIIHFFPCTP